MGVADLLRAEGRERKSIYMSSVMCPKQVRLVPLTLFLLALVFLGSAAAQTEATGTVNAVVDGESRTWYTLLFQVDGGQQPTATFSDDFGANFSIQAHPEKRFSVTGTLSLEFWAFEFPSDCPCVFPEATVMLWTTSSMFENVYQDDEATVTLTSIEPLGEDVFSIEGSFNAKLVFQASIYAEPDPSDTLELEGTFVIQRMSREELLE